MTNEYEDDFEVVRGSGNVFRDLGMADANVLQTKAILASKIIGILDERELSTRAAERLTGTPHADFSRIRNAKLDSFTIDRLMSIFNALDDETEITLSFDPWQQPAGQMPSESRQS